MTELRALLGSAMLTFALFGAQPSQAEPTTLPFSVQARLAGVEVKFPIEATLTTSTQGAPATNGSVELYFRPVIEANALRLAAEDPKLNISNDIARLVVRELHLD